MNGVTFPNWFPWAPQSIHANDASSGSLRQKQGFAW